MWRHSKRVWDSGNHVRAPSCPGFVPEQILDFLRSWFPFCAMGSLSGYLRVAEDGAWWEEAAAHWLVATITVTDTRIKERLLETKRLERTGRVQRKRRPREGGRKGLREQRIPSLYLRAKGKIWEGLEGQGRGTDSRGEAGSGRACPSSLGPPLPSLSRQAASC